MSKIRNISDLKELKEKLLKEKKKRFIVIPNGTCGRAKGSKEVSKAMVEKTKGLSVGFEIKITGCIGFCEVEPIVVILPDRITYVRVKEEDVQEILEAVKNNRIVERLLYKDPTTGNRFEKLEDIPFYKKQMPLIFGKNLEIDPKNILDYISQEGYTALAAVIEGMSPDTVIETIKKAGLRGRGGGGFPTGIKWESCRRAQGDIKYVICNADEGDPGAYMDRAVLEGNPHSVLEGMIIGAYAIGAHEGYIYVRQ
ncbi:hypothetical protein KAX75_01220, partial [candidate division WOR-3 bacterium]|nr:hypothetical protein [candidate division WOR-3 bacterium]